MAYLYDNTGLYRFTLNDEVIRSAPNFSSYVVWTDRDGELYEIYELGKDNDGFYYKERAYTLNSVGNKVLSYNKTIHWSQENDGDFIILVSPYTRPQGTYLSFPDNVIESCVEFINVYPVNQDERLNIESMTWGHDYTGEIVGRISQYIELVIAPVDNYRIIDANLPIIVGYPDDTLGGIKESELLNASVEPINFYTITELRQDGKLHAYVLVGEGYAQLSFLGYQYVKTGIATGKVIKGEYNVNLSLSDITPSNPSATALTSEPYVNVLTANTGYTMDGVEVTVLMNGIPLANVYDSTTHTVNINQVTGDIVISASSRKVHTFNFYSMDGGTLLGSINAPSITNILITLLGTQRTITVEGDIIATYTSPIPDSKMLLGLSLTANSDTVAITLDYLYTGEFTNDVNFYECIVDKPVIPEELTLSLYHNLSKHDVLDKQLSPVGTLTGTLRNNCSIIAPSIEIEYSQVINFDYVYIPQFKRYYYVTDIISIRKNLWRIILKVDVLKSYANIIRLQSCYVLRNQYEYNEDITDTYVSFSYDKKLEYSIIEYWNEIYNFDDIDDNSNLSCILKVIGAI